MLRENRDIFSYESKTQRQTVPISTGLQIRHLTLTSPGWYSRASALCSPLFAGLVADVPVGGANLRQLQSRCRDSSFARCTQVEALSIGHVSIHRSSNTRLGLVRTNLSGIGLAGETWTACLSFLFPERCRLPAQPEGQVWSGSIFGSGGMFPAVEVGG